MKADESTGITAEPVSTREGNDKTAILKEALERGLVGYDYSKDNMDRAERSLNYIFGNHYTVEEIAEKESENRIALTFNKLPQFINKVTGAQRASVQSINVSPTGASIGLEEPNILNSKGDSIKLSRVLTDLIRDIEYQSNAISWYKMAFKHALEGGFGWLRVLTEYQDDGFDLDIKVKGIRNRWSVIYDPAAQESDKSDMNWLFITETMSLVEFNKRYPGKSHETPIDTGTEQSTFWGDVENVTIAEYFRREPYDKTICQLSNGEIHDLDDIKDLFVELEKKGITKTRERVVKSHKVIWCKISGGDILEDDIEFPTSTIPVVPVMGRETDFRTKTLTKGLVDDGIDAQIALNRMRSAALERIDMSPLAPWIATDKAIEGYEDQWAEANSIKWSTLVYKKGEERPTREMGATMPAAELTVSNVLDGDMMDSIGIQPAALGQTSNEVSGKAIRARQGEAEVGTFEFMDNYQNAIRRVGLLCTEMIPRVYDTERIIRIRGEDGSTQTVEINKVEKDNYTGEDIVINDLNFGKHTVVMSSGASYETKREENADQIMNLMSANPQVAQVGSDLLVKNLDFSESDVLAKRLEKTIPPQYLSKEKQEELAKDAPEPQPDPNAELAAKMQELAQQEQALKTQQEQFKTQQAELKVEQDKLKVMQEQIKLDTLEIETGENDIKKSEENDEKAKDNLAKKIAETIQPGATTS